MKIALMGHGKMGKLIEQIAISQGHTIAITIARSNFSREVFNSLEKADVCLDFSHSSCVLEHVSICAERNKPLIIGTTGWDEQKQTVQQIVRQSNIGCLYAPNFSIGVKLFMQIVNYAAQLINSFQDYDVSGIELHHKQKLDTPSGTAKSLIEVILKQMSRLDNIEFASVRSGQIYGTHTIRFDGPQDSISLTHEAHNREGFARGALEAAQWILDKVGFFTLEDMLKDQFIFN